MSCISGEIEEIIDPFIDLIAFTGLTRPYTVFFPTTRNEWQSPIKHSFRVNTGRRNLPPDQAYYHHKNQRCKYFKESADWLSLPIDKVLAHERLEMSPRMSGHVQAIFDK